MEGQTRNKPSNVFSEHFWRTLWRRFFGGGAKITAIAIRSDNRPVREDDCAADPVPDADSINLIGGDDRLSLLVGISSDGNREGFATVTLSFGEKGTSLLRPRGRIVP
jgi:hypothetical protein